MPRLTLFVALVAWATPALAGEVGRWTSPTKSFEIVVSTPTKGQGLRLNKIESLDVELIPKLKELSVNRLVFDARMPEHDHGMLVKPVATKTGAYTFRVDGVKLHMAGNWKLHFRLDVQENPAARLESVEIEAPYKL